MCFWKKDAGSQLAAFNLCCRLSLAVEMSGPSLAVYMKVPISCSISFMFCFGSPIKGRVKRKNTSPWKKKLLFFLTHALFVIFQNRQHLSLSAPVISSCGSRKWSAPVTHQVQGECISGKCVIHGPWSVRTPENLQCRTVANCLFSNLMVVNQPRTGSRYRRIRI
jgi:hypothetical protein